jgi:hypothetical protein
MNINNVLFVGDLESLEQIIAIKDAISVDAHSIIALLVKYGDYSFVLPHEHIEKIL